MTPFIVFLALLTVFSVVDASYIQIESPISGRLYNNGSIYIGKVGPGESFSLLASATTTNASGTLVNIGWDTLVAVQLPPGWSAQPSPKYQDPMKIKITADPNALNGTYEMVLRAVNLGNYSKLGNLTFDVFVNVTPDVFESNVTPTDLSVGVGQPTNLYVNINNTGASDDPFIIDAIGLPAWNVSDEVISLHSTRNAFVYPVLINQPGVYHFNLTVSSATSPRIQKTFNIRMVAHASLLNDYGAVGQGALLSPVIYEPVYAAMLLIKYIYAAIFG